MSLNIEFKITGEKKLLDKIKKLEKSKIDDVLKQGVIDGSELVLTTLQKNTPVDTGLLKSSETILYDTNGLKSFIGPADTLSPHYAPDVEYGFHHWISGKFIPGQSYVENTYLQTKDRVVGIFRGHLKNIL